MATEVRLSEVTLLLGAVCAWTASSFEVRVTCERPPSAHVKLSPSPGVKLRHRTRETAQGEGREERADVSGRDGGSPDWSAGAVLLECGRAAAMGFLRPQPYLKSCFAPWSTPLFCEKETNPGMKCCSTAFILSDAPAHWAKAL